MARCSGCAGASTVPGPTGPAGATGATGPAGESGIGATGVTSIYLPAADLVFDTAFIAFVVVDSVWPVLALPDGTARFYAGSFVVPDGWATCKISMRWANATAGAGNVTLRVDFGAGTDGSTMNRDVVGTPVVAAALGINVLKTTELITGQAVTPGDLAVATVMRLGSDGGDTLGDAIHLYGVLVEKVT